MSKEGKLSDDFISLIDDWLAVVVVDGADFTITHVTTMADKLLRFDPDIEIVGSVIPGRLKNLAFETDLKAYPKGVVRKKGQNFAQVAWKTMVPLAKQTGLATSGCWILEPETGKLVRVSFSVRYFESQDVYCITITPVEDATTIWYDRLLKNGHCIKAGGGELSRADLELIVLYMQGYSLKRIQAEVAESEATVRKELKRVAEALGHKTPGKMREALFLEKIEDFQLEPEALMPGKASLFRFD